MNLCTIRDISSAYQNGTIEQKELSFLLSTPQSACLRHEQQPLVVQRSQLNEGLIVVLQSTQVDSIVGALRDGLQCLVALDQFAGVLASLLCVANTLLGRGGEDRYTWQTAPKIQLTCILFAQDTAMYSRTH